MDAHTPLIYRQWPLYTGAISMSWIQLEMCCLQLKNVGPFIQECIVIIIPSVQHEHAESSFFAIIVSTNLLLCLSCQHRQLDTTELKCSGSYSCLSRQDVFPQEATYHVCLDIPDPNNMTRRPLWSAALHLCVNSKTHRWNRKYTTFIWLLCCYFLPRA